MFSSPTGRNREVKSEKLKVKSGKQVAEANAISLFLTQLFLSVIVKFKLCYGKKKLGF
jgi:hypothetical protein